jgi:hypothetical protein
MNWLHEISGPYEEEDDRIEKILIWVLVIATGFLLGLIIKYQFSEPVFYDRPEGMLSRMHKTQ